MRGGNVCCLGVLGCLGYLGVVGYRGGGLYPRGRWLRLDGVVGPLVGFDGGLGLGHRVAVLLVGEIGRRRLYTLSRSP